jgi:transposase
MSNAEDDSVCLQRPERRQWPKEFKVQIVAESYAPGASIAGVARRHGINANLLFTWRKRFGESKSIPAGKAVKILPVTLTDIAAPDPETSSEGSGRMEIVLAAGDRIIVGADVDTIALTRVIKALSRR